MNLLRNLAALVAVVLAFGADVSSGQESAATPAQPPPAPAAPATPAAPDGTRGAVATAPAAAADEDEFIPSEEISADEEVTFPVDI